MLAVMALISCRMPSTGRSARRVTSQVTPATTMSSTGSPNSMELVTVETASCWASREAPE